jgi:hypothetical protein
VTTFADRVVGKIFIPKRISKRTKANENTSLLDPGSSAFVIDLRESQEPFKKGERACRINVALGSSCGKKAQNAEIPIWSLSQAN